MEAGLSDVIEVVTSDCTTDEEDVKPSANNVDPSDNPEVEASISDSGKKLSRWQFATQGTVLSSIFILVKTCVGAGTLSLPFAFAQGGLIFSSVVFFIVMLIAIHVGTMIFACGRYTNELYPDKKVDAYADLAEVAFGKLGKIAVLLTIAVSQFLFLIALMILARDQLQDIVSFGLLVTGYVPECSPLTNCTVLMCIAFLPIFPVTLFRNLTALQFITYFSIFCVIFVVIAMTVDTTLYWTTNTNVSISDQTIQLFPVSFPGSITAISYCSLSFVCQFNIVRLQKELRGRPTKLRLYAINIGYAVIAYTIFNIAVFAGYFRFFEDLKENVILNYSRRNYLLIAARVALLFMLITSYPVGLHPGRDATNSVFLLVHDLISSKFCKKKKSTKNGQNTNLRANGESENVNTIETDMQSPKPDSVSDKDELQSPSECSGSTGKEDSRSAGESKHGNHKVPTVIWFCETYMFFALSFIPASFILNVGIVWNFVSSIGGVLILYIYPAAIYLKLRYARYKKRGQDNNISIRSQYTTKAAVEEVIAWCILLIGIVLLFLTNYQALYTVIETGNDSGGLCFQLECRTVELWNQTYFDLS
ncbi:solute carrier family 38 member 6-like isoform X3 [Halichondria panicea]|uniref:solute carrier family 38 member 6-like isoform X3 n=1 Tax=Halichondria panicea TaxID=6063 RepID=UPI00312B33CA